MNVFICECFKTQEKFLESYMSPKTYFFIFDHLNFNLYFDCPFDYTATYFLHDSRVKMELHYQFLIA